MSAPEVATRKRGRGSPVPVLATSAGALEYKPPVVILRQDMLDRIGNLDPSWTSVATRYHTAPNLDAVISSIGKDIVASLQELSAKAQFER